MGDWDEEMDRAGRDAGIMLGVVVAIAICAVVGFVLVLR